MDTRIRHFLFVLALTPGLSTVVLAGESKAEAASQTAGESVVHVQRGKATFYGPGFHGRRTASGERFDQNSMVAAHPSLPFGTVVRVTNIRNGVSAEVRIVDRGPARGPQRRGVVIDLSKGAARELGFLKHGRVPVRLDVLRSEPADNEVLLGARRESPG